MKSCMSNPANALILQMSIVSEGHSQSTNSHIRRNVVNASKKWCGSSTWPWWVTIEMKVLGWISPTWHCLNVHKCSQTVTNLAPAGIMFDQSLSPDWIAWKFQWNPWQFSVNGRYQLWWWLKIPHNIIPVSNHASSSVLSGADITQGAGPFINMDVTSSGIWTLGLASMVRRLHVVRSWYESLHALRSFLRTTSISLLNVGVVCAITFKQQL